MELDFNSFQHHPTAEKIVQVMQDRMQSDETLFYRLMVANHFAMAAATMRCAMQMPEGSKIPINMYSVELAPSNFGKTRTARIMTKEVLNQFTKTFIDQTFPLLAEDNINKLAVKRANRRATDPDEESERMVNEYNRAGALMFCFDSGSAPGAKQLRHKLLLADAGALNLVVDEVGLNMGKNSEMIDLFMELYDGETGNALNKNTKENPRNSELKGVTPANMLLFGTDNKIFDGGRQEEEFMTLLKSGYGRRCFFAYVSEEDAKKHIVPAAEALKRAKRAASSSTLEDISDDLHALADIINNKKVLMMPDTTAELMYGYKENCERRARKLKRAQHLQATELEARFFKTAKLAGIYAFIDDAVEISEDHMKAAIKVAEESGKAFQKMLSQDKPHVKLAKHIADLQENVTHSDLMEDLSFYPRAANQRQDMLTLAISWGYKNNVIIKKEFDNGIEFLRGETLEETNLDRLKVAYSNDIATGYRNEYAPWDQLHNLTQANGMHWINHFLSNGHRQEDNCDEGFNLVVFDVDGGVSLDMARTLLKDYTYMLYTTKRHTDQNPRFRLIFPTSHVLKMDAKDYKLFMKNLYDWLPFEVDDATGQRARKWLSHNGHYEYNDGDLLGVLPFIPKTAKNEERKARLDNQQSLDNLERWFINNTGDGNRNNQLLRFALILADVGYGFDGVRRRVLELNDKLPDNLDEQEIMSTIMVSVGRRLAGQQQAA